MRRRWWFVGVVLLITVPLVFLLRDFARDVLALELFRVAWALGVVLDSLPQVPLWWLFLALAAFLAMRSLFGRFDLRRKKTEVQAEPLGEVHLLAGRIRRANEGDYFRWRLARELGHRSLYVLAYRRQTEVAGLRQQLDSGRLDVPPEVEAYIRAGQAPVYSLSAGLLTRFGQRLSPRRWAAAPEQSATRIVEFMEDQMEATHDSGAG